MQVKVLFVCLGNICRSPMAESIFRQLVQDAGLRHCVSVDSAGTGGWHVGELPDKRTRAVLERENCPPASRARQISSKDFEEFDYVIAMDQSNVANLREWPGAQPEKVSLMLEWHQDADRIEVPDPYYGELDGFDEVYRLLVPACQGLLEDVKSRLAVRSA